MHTRFQEALVSNTNPVAPCIKAAAVCRQISADLTLLRPSKQRKEEAAEQRITGLEIDDRSWTIKPCIIRFGVLETYLGCTEGMQALIEEECWAWPLWAVCQRQQQGLIAGLVARQHPQRLRGHSSRLWGLMSALSLCLAAVLMDFLCVHRQLPIPGPPCRPPERYERASITICTRLLQSESPPNFATADSAHTPHSLSTR